MDYILAAGGILQIYLTGKKKRIGWLVGIATSIAWTYFAVSTAQYGFIISAAIFATLHYKNWVAWKTPANTETDDK